MERCILGVDATSAAPMNPNSKSVVVSSIIDKCPKSVQQDVLSLFVNGYRLQHGEANFEEIYRIMSEQKLLRPNATPEKLKQMYMRTGIPNIFAVKRIERVI